MIKVYNIWSEGFRATGQSGGATFHGSADGKDFKHACTKYFASAREGHFFKASSMTYWGCRLYSDEGSARASFG